MNRNISYVPVFVDNLNYARESKMTRLSYFYVECSEPHHITYVDNNNSLPLLLIDMEGVIMSGLGRKRLFNTPKAISELFDFIDKKTPLVVSTSYFWLPAQILNKTIKKKLSRGDVLRIYTPLFLQACAQVKVSPRILLKNIPTDVRAVYFSEKESLAFKKWTDMVVDRVRKRYYGQPKNNLISRYTTKGK